MYQSKEAGINSYVINTLEAKMLTMKI